MSKGLRNALILMIIAIIFVSVNFKSPVVAAFAAILFLVYLNTRG